VTFTDDSKPSMLYYGVHGEQDTMKSEFYHAVDMTKTLFKDQTDMVQHVHTGLSELYKNYKEGHFLFVSGDKNTGETPVGKNWATKSVFKPMTGVSIGDLRKSVEQHSLKMHLEDPESHTLADCVEVHRRCQHLSRTAMDKYVLGAIGKMKGDAPTENTATDEVADAVEAIVDEVENAFDPVESFEGPRTGYEFKTGVRGLGYYLIGYDFGPEITASEDESVPSERVVYRPAEGAVPYLDKMRTRLCLWWSKEALVRDFPVPDDLIATLTSDQVDDLVTKYGLSELDVIIYGAPWAEDTPDEDTDAVDAMVDEDTEETMDTTVENIEDTEVTEDTDTEEDTESSSESEDENDGDDGPGPAVRALIAAFTAAYESDRKRRRR
jgi:hypothetical protein